MMIYDWFRTRLFRFVLFLILFGLMAASVVFHWAWIPAVDHAVQTAVFSLRSDLLTAVLTPLTYSGNWQAVTAICLLLLILPPTRRWYGIPMTASAVVSVSLYQLLKYQVKRPRPDVALHLIVQDGFSFPSGHTLSCTMVWGTFLLLLYHYRRTAYCRPLQSQQIGPAARFSPSVLRRPNPGDEVTVILTVAVTVYIILMGLSRIYLGVHWPTDVFASWCLGLALLAPVSKCIERL